MTNDSFIWSNPCPLSLFLSVLPQTKSVFKARQKHNIVHGANGITVQQPRELLSAADVVDDGVIVVDVIVVDVLLRVSF